MANVTRTRADEAQPLPRRLIYRRLLRGLQHHHDGWLFTREDLAEEGIPGDAVTKLRDALGLGWCVDEYEEGEMIITRRTDIAKALTSVERAFRDPVGA